jgi:hypothetical protein
MPNDCENYVTVTGPEAEVSRFIGEVVTTGPDARGGNGSVLDAEKILPRPQDQANDEEWYYENWGTKWNSYCGAALVYEKQFDGHALLELEFCSAWGPFSLELYKLLSQRFPDLVISCRYKEPGMGFTGVTTVQGGDIKEAKSEELRRCHYGELKAESAGVWIVIDRKEAAVVVEGAEELLPVLEQLWRGEGKWFFGSLPALPDRATSLLGDQGLSLELYFPRPLMPEEIETLHARVVEFRRRLLQPNEDEAIEMLAHTDNAVREYALKRVVEWRKPWRGT